MATSAVVDARVRAMNGDGRNSPRFEGSMASVPLPVWNVTSLFSAIGAVRKPPV